MVHLFIYIQKYFFDKIFSSSGDNKINVRSLFLPRCFQMALRVPLNEQNVVREDAMWKMNSFTYHKISYTDQRKFSQLEAAIKQ